MLKNNNGVLTFTPFKSQHQFLTYDGPELMYSGGVGVGKSTCLGLKVVMRASRPGACELLIHKVGSVLKKTTLLLLTEGTGDQPPILPEGSYEWNKTEQWIKIQGGGRIWYMGCDEPEKLRGINASGAGIDEATLLTAEDYSEIGRRIRVRIPGLPLQRYLATNPDGPSHHLAKRFGLGDKPAEPGTFNITACSEENIYLPEQYLNELRRLTGVERQRFYLGQWVAYEGLVYPEWDREVHLVQDYREDWARVIIACDDGSTNESPFVALRICIDENKRAHVQREVRGNAKTILSQRVKMIEDLSDGEASAVIIDPAAKALRDEVARTGLRVIAANNRYEQGLPRVRERFARKGGGLPALTIDPSCKELIGEIEGYKWGPERDGKQLPIKKHDHGCDALRYGIHYLDRGRNVIVRQVGERDLSVFARNEGETERQQRDRVKATLEETMRRNIDRLMRCEDI